MIGIIIQARMGSTRLPKKVLKKIRDKNILEHILFRLSKLQYSANIVIATSTLEKDDVIQFFCDKKVIQCFRGSETNVLERYYLCAKENNFEHIVRLTGDNPFTDTEEIDNLVELHLKTDADYSKSFASLPKGVGAEIFTFQSLEKSYLNSTKSNHFEHVNEYIEENETLFKISELQTPESKNRPDLSLTVDTLEDYKKACFIVENAISEYITTEEAIELCLRFA